MIEMKYENPFSCFIEAGTDYAPEALQEELSSLKAWECYDYEELHEMRQQPGFDPIACRVLTEAEIAAVEEATATVAGVVVVFPVRKLADDAREFVRVARAGFSQAPPPLWVLSVANDDAAVLNGEAA